MGVKVVGPSWQKETQRAIKALSDGKVEYELLDIVDDSAVELEIASALSGSSEMPQMFVDGVDFVGLGSILAYIGN